MDCSACGHPNRETARFCRECGALLGGLCPGCGAEMEAGARFCDGCGRRLDPTRLESASPRKAATAWSSAGRRTPPQDARTYTPAHLARRILNDRGAVEGERRTVTVLFADAVGSTPIAARIGEEEMYALVQGCLVHMMEAVHHYEGHVANFTGDGVMAVFGAPIAHEESERRAVAAALRMQESLIAYSRDVSERHDIELRFRVGLNTGPVVVGRVSDELNMDFTAIGDTVNLAARMQQVAEPGAVYLTEATHRGVGDHFDCEPVGAVQVKGRDEPLPTWRALRERAMRTRFEVTAQRGLAPFVGRHHELSVLEAHLDQVRHGRGHVVVVSGEAGIGKSRLLLEFRRGARAGDATWLEGHCISYGRSTPYLPIVDLIKRAFGVEEGDDEARIVERLELGTQPWDSDARSAIPYLRYLLRADPGDVGVAGMDPRERRVGIFAALRTLLLQQCRNGPLVAMIEDLHWVDEMSQAAVASLVDVVATAPLLLVLTTRSGERDPVSERVSSTRLVLDHLAEAESVALVRGVLDGSILSPELEALVTGKAEGNPFFTEEVVRSLLETGVIARCDGAWRLQRAVDEVRIPDTIQEVILARIDRLDRAAKEAVQLASVIGREFTARVLDRMSDREARLSGILAELEAHGLIDEKSLHPEPAYVFKHALTQEVAYSTLLAERRRGLHRQAGAAVEELYQDRLAEHYETLAHHYVEGREWTKAVRYLEKAGDKAGAAYANADALRFYARALDVCETLGKEGGEALASSAVKRAFVNFGMGDLPAAIADLDRVAVAGRRLPDRALEGIGLSYRGLLELSYHDLERGEATLTSAWAVVEEGFEEVRPLASLGLTLLFVYSNRWAEAEPLLAWARTAQIAPDPFTEGMWNWCRGVVEYWRGRFDEALQILEELPEHAGRIVTTRLINGWTRGMALASRGEYDSALSELRTTLATCERVGDWQIRPRVVNTIGWVFAEVEAHELAQGWNRRGVELAGSIPGMPDPEIEMNARLNLADNLAALGRSSEAAEQFRTVEAVVRDPRPTQRWLLWRYSLHFLHSYGELWLDGGEPAEALACADECIALAMLSSSRKYVVKGRRLRGQALVRTGRLDEAERELLTALEIAVEVRNPPQLWKTHAALADLRRRQGRPDAAREAYGAALSVIERMARTLADPAMREPLRHFPQVEDIRRAAGPTG